MSHPDYDPTADPLDLEEVEEATRAWVAAQMDRLAQIRADKETLEAERKAIQDELIPVLTKLGRPLRWRDPVTHEESLVTPVAAEMKEVDWEYLIELAGEGLRSTIESRLKKTLPFAEVERLVNEGVITMEQAGPATKFKPKAPYVKF